jgi:hypothetical protein
MCFCCVSSLKDAIEARFAEILTGLDARQFLIILVDDCYSSFDNKVAVSTLIFAFKYFITRHKDLVL